MRIEGTVHIQADITSVFQTFSDLDNIDNVVNSITALEVLTPPAQMQVGTKWKETRTVFGKEATETMWVTELVANSHYVVEAESHGTHYKSTYTFIEEEGGTRVHMSFEGTPLTFASRIMSCIGVFFKGATKKLLMQDLQALKAYLERS